MCHTAKSYLETSTFNSYKQHVLHGAVWGRFTVKNRHTKHAQKQKQTVPTPEKAHRSPWELLPHSALNSLDSCIVTIKTSASSSLSSLFPQSSGGAENRLVI